MKKVALFGVPRSGTSWLSQLFNSHPSIALRFQPLFSFEHKERLNMSSSFEDIDAFFNEILNSSDEMALMTSRAHKGYPSFVKSDIPSTVMFKETRYLNLVEHLLAEDCSLKIIGIIRNPLSTIASWYKAPKEFDPRWSIFEEWKYANKKNQGRDEEFYGFYKWLEVTRMFVDLEKKYPLQFKIVKYSDLNDNTESTIRSLFDFLSLKVESQTIDFIQQSKSRHDDDPYSVYRAKANDQAWKDILPIEISDEIQKLLSDYQLEDYLV
ncbi:sulfotransferase [Vibrio chagasii]|uniref:sulfotransferase family protein n=1 Tax=Vibrio chagasii TaxID=170679 RepID=UPI003552FBE1